MLCVENSLPSVLTRKIFHLETNPLKIHNKRKLHVQVGQTVRYIGKKLYSMISIIENFEYDTQRQIIKKIQAK